MSKNGTGWKDIPIGGLILEAGNASKYLTGGWKVQSPVHDKAKCINCLVCWIYCPDSAILVKDGKIAGFDLDHCKGCGICAEECPPKIKAIEMKKDE
ncbi:4Fe-4S binding protein [Candidatus Desantisbacteria bacterium]|nr:4Fe-4S binding protein [Candidatus Desantisbacteria bacterium]